MALPSGSPEWLAKCKAEYDASRAAGGEAGSSIFSRNCTSLTENIMLFIKYILRGDYLHFQELKKHEDELCKIMGELRLGVLKRVVGSKYFL